jgi:hypothetical protein
VIGRTIVRVRNTERNKAVYCEALTIDRNFLRNYNAGGRDAIVEPANAIVLNAWYRKRLGGLETRKDYALSVSVEEHLVGRVRCCLDHPQIVVRLATWLALLGVVLGLIGVWLGIKSLPPS